MLSKNIALYHNLKSGGSKRELFEFTKRMKLEGNIVSVYTHEPEKGKYLDLTDLINDVFVSDYKKLKNISFTLPFFKSILNLVIDVLNIHRLKKVSKSMASKIDKNNYDFVFVHHNKDYVQSPFILKYLKTRTVYFCAEPMRVFYDASMYRMLKIHLERRTNAILRIYTFITDLVDRPCKKILSNKIKKHDFENIQYCDLVLTNSYYSRERILAAYGKESKVVYLGGDSLNATDDSYPNEPPKKENIVVSVGAINPLKGYDFIVETLGKVNKHIRPTLVIIGNAVNLEYMSFLERLAKTNKVKINIKSNLSDCELSRYIRQAKIFLYAPYLEPLGLAPLEAMALGTPVIAVKEGGPRETIKDQYNGLLVERDSKLFTEAITLLLQSPDEQARLAKNAFDDIQNYWNWNAAYNRLTAAIKIA